MRNRIIFLILILLIVACDPLPIGDDVPTPTQESLTATPAIVPTETTNIWLPGVDCSGLARSLTPGFQLANGNPCLQRVFISHDNGVDQAYPLGYEVVSEPGATEYGQHALIWHDTDHRSLVVEFTDGAGGHINGAWGWQLRGQHIPANQCAAIKITGISMFDDIADSHDPRSLSARITINNGVQDVEFANFELPEAEYWEAFWIIYTTNPSNVFDITFQVGVMWATVGGYAEILSLELLIAPSQYCDGDNVTYF